MGFIRRVVGDAFRLLVSAPLDLILAVAGLYIVGAVLTLGGGPGFLALGADFIAGSLLVAGLLGQPEADRLGPAASRLGRRLGPVVRQLLIVIVLFIGIAIVAGILGVVIVAVAGPAIGITLDDLGTFGANPAAPVDRATALMLGIAFVTFIPFFARLLPSTAIVLDREVGAMESLRASWAATRRRTLACAGVFLVITAPAWIILAFLPLVTATFLAILPTVLGGAAGVAAYRALLPDAEEPSGPPAPTI